MLLLYVIKYVFVVKYDEKRTVHDKENNPESETAGSGHNKKSFANQIKCLA